MADVLLVVIGLGVEIGEIGEQQNDRQDQHDEQRRDPGAAARALGRSYRIGLGRESGIPLQRHVEKTRSLS
ncbi:hypothetical protein D3C84_1302520 [compost metagenome]